MKTALILIADGTEEMEAVITIDVLRRAEWQVTVAAMGTRHTITASRGVQITADILFEEADPLAANVLILPGGMDGTMRFCEFSSLLDALRMRNEQGQWIAAICAAPLVLQAAGILDSRHYTCHPGVQDDFTTGIRVDFPVHTDGHMITSQGPGTAFLFALEILTQVSGSEVANTVRHGLCLQ